jgi:hypothetical protein
MKQKQADETKGQAPGICLTITFVIFLFLTINLTNSNLLKKSTHRIAIISDNDFEQLEAILSKIESEQKSSTEFIATSKKLYDDIFKAKDVEKI